MRPSPLGLTMLMAGLAVAWQTLHLRRAARRSRRIAGASPTFELRVPGARSRVLVLGDSTGVGVGAGSPSQSLPGLLADEFPDVEIVNACHIGARVADALQQLRPWLEANERFDLVLLFVGGNDVLRLTPWPQLQRAARLLLQHASQCASHTVWLGSANIGGAPLLKGPLAWWLGRRTGTLMRRLARLAHAHGARFIDFYQPRHRDIFARQPSLYFAEDGVHPSAASYRHCYEALKRQVPLPSLLAADCCGAAAPQ
jgi:lysophospholipase L1-like esterase